MKELFVAVLFGATLCMPNRAAFAQDVYSIRVESHQVLVPTTVFDKDRTTAILTQTESDCVIKNAEALNRLRPDDAYIPIDCHELGEIGDLTAKDFRIFEDGIEQKIQNVTRERSHDIIVRDNVARHDEYSNTARGKWSYPDPPSQVGFIPGAASYFYRIAYAPPHSEEGKCHRIKVKVHRRNLSVSYRNRYCYIEHSSFDPLNGTPFGGQMEANATSGQAGGIDLFLQSSFFYVHADAVRVDLTLEFPWNSLKREWIDGNLYRTIGILGMVSQKEGGFVSRFSDLECCSSDFSKPPPLSEHTPHPELDFLEIPTRYETQIDVPPGEYSLQVVLSDGTKFGRVQVPLTMDEYDGKQLAISSVVLCKRFRNAAVAAQEAATANLAPEYVPLVSKGVQFTPAGDTRFKKGEPLFAYFEVYEPLTCWTAIADSSNSTQDHQHQNRRT